MKRLMALMALTVLTACDYSARKDLRSERDDRLYRAAMDDYRAGRMEAALSGFEKAINNDPANASARFQLACLQQDLKKDYLSAYCGYREFLLQHPESDRSKLARDRMAVCEGEMARTLATKHGLNSAEEIEKRLANALAEIKALRDRVAAAEKNLGSSQERVRTLSAERERLLGAVKGLGEEMPSSTPDSQSILKEKASLERETAEETGLRQDVLSEKRLLEEDEKDEVSTGSSLIPVRKPGDVVVQKAPPSAEKKEDAAPAHPKTYVVKEGDTLYGVAKRFYGSIRAWKTIRDANKALISSDNRLKVGDTIVLP